MLTLDSLNSPAEEEEDSFDYEAAILFEKTLGILDYPPNEPAYVLAEDDPSWARGLRINEFLSHVRDISETEIREATSTLACLQIGQLRSWLPWLMAMDWTGPLLLAFLAFRQVWDTTDRWWEVTYWDTWLSCWYPRKSSQFSLDSSYELVKARLGYPADQMIDDAWYEDWEKHAAWRYGFTSFAEFALFRAIEKDEWRKSLREIRLELEQQKFCDEGWGQQLKTDNSWGARHRREQRKSAKEMLFDDPWTEAAAFTEKREMREEDIE